MAISDRVCEVCTNCIVKDWKSLIALGTMAPLPNVILFFSLPLNNLKIKSVYFLYHTSFYCRHEACMELTRNCDKLY